MDFIGNIISAVIGGVIGAGLTYWRMRVDKAARRDTVKPIMAKKGQLFFPVLLGG